jgi:hypothetical protein
LSIYYRKNKTYNYEIALLAGLVLWDSIEASEEWIEDQVPATIKPYCFVKPTEDHIDYEAMK